MNISCSFTTGRAGRRYVRNVERHLIDLGVVELLNITQHPDVLGGNEINGNTLATETTTTTNTMDIVLAVGGEIVVDNERDLLDIDTTGQQVGGNEHTRRSRTELLHEELTLLLVHISVLQQKC